MEYAELHSLMRACSLTQGPAEAQGIAAGLFAVRGDAADAAWAGEFQFEQPPGNPDTDRCREALAQLRTTVGEDPMERDFSFGLLLPDGPLKQRAGALRDWCQGFLFGFGIGGPGALEGLSGEGREAIHDFGEISRLDIDDVPEDEGSGASLAELEEYIRMAAIVVVEDTRQDGAQ